MVVTFITLDGHRRNRCQDARRFREVMDVLLGGVRIGVLRGLTAKNLGPVLADPTEALPAAVWVPVHEQQSLLTRPLTPPRR